jgi:hypothetical protein
MLKLSTVMLVLSFILGCSSGPSGPRSAGPAPDAAPPPKTVFDPLTQQLDRARDVQNTVDRNKEDARKALDRQERGDSPP